MNCPYLSGKYFKSCAVSREAYVPSTYEMDEYCATNRHSLCPCYRKRLYELPLENRPVLASGVPR